MEPDRGDKDLKPKLNNLKIQAVLQVVLFWASNLYAPDLASSFLALHTKCAAFERRLKVQPVEL